VTSAASERIKALKNGWSDDLAQSDAWLHQSYGQGDCKAAALQALAYADNGYQRLKQTGAHCPVESAQCLFNSAIAHLRLGGLEKALTSLGQATIELSNLPYVPTDIDIRLRLIRSTVCKRAAEQLPPADAARKRFFDMAAGDGHVLRGLQAWKERAYADCELALGMYITGLTHSAELPAWTWTEYQAGLLSEWVAGSKKPIEGLDPFIAQTAAARQVALRLLPLVQPKLFAPKDSADQSMAPPEQKESVGVAAGAGAASSAFKKPQQIEVTIRIPQHIVKLRPSRPLAFAAGAGSLSIVVSPRSSGQAAGAGKMPMDISPASSPRSTGAQKIDLT
jgi:hypothetical protein